MVALVYTQLVFGARRINTCTSNIKSGYRRRLAKAGSKQAEVDSPALLEAGCTAESLYSTHFKGQPTLCLSWEQSGTVATFKVDSTCMSLPPGVWTPY